MAVYVNRTISLMGGDDPGIQGTSLAVGPMGDARSVSDSSPLQIFVRAKKKINDIFVEIEVYVHDTVTYMQSVQQDGSIVKPDDAVQVEGYIANVRAIQNVLTRNHMKVVFFGRTSNGKSSVINAMLHEKILPSGFGHTTNCFLQVNGSDNGRSYLVTEGSTEKQNVKSVEQLAHASYMKKLGENQLVDIYWPKDKCLLLKHDVVFVDSPGIDMGSNLDEWIDNHCLDADVFVFVANAESTLTLAEKNFFHKVSTRLAKPNIFILNNRWDVVASEPDFCDQVRAQHMERAVEFLVKELKVCTQEEANKRIFFVSAKEALQARLQKQRRRPALIVALADSFQNRYLEFQYFEQKFEECISKSAVRTKFEQCSQRGKIIVSEIRQIMGTRCEQAQQLKTEKAVARKEIYDKLNFTKQQLLLLTQEMVDKIRQMVEDVKQRVSKALSEEIDHLSVLVDDFNLPFDSEQNVLNGYKKELNHLVEERLVSNMYARLSTPLAMDIENSQREMTERMSSLLPAEKKQVLLDTLPQQEPFEISYHIKWGNLCDDFHEDIEFSFSLMKVSDILPKKIVKRDESEVRQLQEDRKNTSAWSMFTSAALVVGSVIADAVLVSAATAAATAAASTAAAFVAGKYIVDRFKWKSVGQEREFKQQYFDHVTKKLELIIGSTSANCSDQVEKELSETFEQLNHLVNEAIDAMDVEIKTLDKEIEQLDDAANSAIVLQNKASDIIRQLEIFDDIFLKLRN